MKMGEKSQDFTEFTEVADYLLSKAFTERVKKFPCWGELPLSEQHALYDLMKAKEVSREARKLKEEYEVAINGYRQHVEDQVRSFRQMLTEYESLVIDNEQKRFRAEERLRMYGENDPVAQQLADARADLERLLGYERKFQLQISALRKFDVFMEHVITGNAQFKCATDVMQRFEVLQVTGDIISRTYAQVVNELELRILVYKEIMKESTDRMEMFTNKVTQLRGQLDELQHNKSEAEERVHNIRWSIAQDTFQLAQAQSALFSLYQSVCRWKQIVPTLKISDWEQQVLEIKRGILLIKEVDSFVDKMVEDEEKKQKKKQQQQLRVASDN